MAYDVYDLHDFEDQLEPAVAGILASQLALAGVTDPVQILVTRDADDLTTPRLEVSFALSLAMAQRTAQGQAAPKQVPNAFEGRISVAVVTTRPVPGANGDLHGRLRGVVRWSLAAGAKAFSSANLPYLQILDCLPEAQSPRVFDEKEQDISQLNYHVWFAINNSAWPSLP